MRTKRKGSVRHVVVGCGVLVLVASVALCQTQIRGHNQIESLIDEWNFANNAKNIHSFERVYADQLSYYGSSVSQSDAIEQKQQLFRDQPSFRQRIITEISYSAQPTGVTRAAFMREVYDGASWRRRQSFLDVDTNSGRYIIVGEWDGETRQSSDQGVALPDLTPQPVPPRVDSMSTSITDLVPVLPRMEHPDSIVEDLAVSPLTRRDTAAIRRETPGNAFSMFSSGDVVVPRLYVLILIAILAVGGLMIFVADSIQSRRAKRVRASRTPEDAEHVVRDVKVHAAFEAFVVTLFDPLYFKSFRPKAEYVLAGEGGRVENGPDLVIDYTQNDMSLRFAIVCQYYRHAAKSEVELPSPAQQGRIREFQSEPGMDVYYVLGFGGKPDDPKQLFFVPAGDVQDEYISRTHLRQYSKSGMFYYNRRNGRIQ